MSLSKNGPRAASIVLALLLTSGAVIASEVTVQNDSLAKGGTGTIQAGFVAGESGAAWLTTPCSGRIVAVQVFWRSFFGGTGPTLGESIKVFSAGAFPSPGAELADLEGPVLTDGVINEFRFLDDQMTIPLNVPVNSGQTFVVSFTFLDTPPGLGPSLVTDTGCQAGKNALFAIPGGWLNSCSLGVSGDWVIRAVVDCNGACCLPGGSCTDGQPSGPCSSAGGTFQGNDTACATVNCPLPTEACCFLPTGCLNLTASNCGVAGGFPQGPGTSCATVICFPMGACCHPDGSCDDDVSPEDCAANGGTFQGDGTMCSSANCPQPFGACCLSNGNCLELQQADCSVIPNSAWAGPFTTCADGNSNGTADDCEGACFEDSECADSDPCTTDDCKGGQCTNVYLMKLYGDIAPPGGNGTVDVSDIVCVLDGFADVQLCPDADIDPCEGNGVIDVSDISAILDAFADVATCPDPCP